MDFFIAIDLITTSWPAYSDDRRKKEILTKIKSNARKYSVLKASKD